MQVSFLGYQGSGVGGKAIPSCTGFVCPKAVLLPLLFLLRLVLPSVTLTRQRGLNGPNSP